MSETKTNKRPQDLTDEELAKRLFPAPVRKAVKDEVGGPQTTEKKAWDRS